MRRGWKIAWTAAVLCVATGTAAAEPSYSQELDEYTLSRAKTELRDLARREGIDAETADILLKLDVFATSNDTGCPGVDVDIINATGRTIWNIEAKIEQKDGSKHREDVVHLPYMTAKSKVRINVSCLQDYTYRSRYDYSGSSGITLNYSAQGSKSIDEALPLMIEQKVDYSNVGAGVSPSVDKSDSLLVKALEMNDRDVAKELVQAIARTGTGAKELGDVIEKFGGGAIADEVVAAMSKLPPAQQAQLARTLLASNAALKWKDKLLPMIDKQLCGGNRADAVGLWITAQTPGGIPVEDFRTRVSEKCKPTKADGPAITAALEKNPDAAGGTLDAVDDELFAGAVAAWGKVKAPAISQSLLAYLRDGQKTERFDAAVKQLGADKQALAIATIIETPDGAGAKHKADWVTAQFASISSAELDPSVTLATKTMVTGGVKAPAMRDAIKGLAKLAPKAVEDVMVAQASTSSRVFDAEKLQAAGLDMAEFLAFNAELGDCTATVELLDSCLKKIAAYKDKTGEGALKKQARSAVKPEFLSSVRSLLEALREPQGLIVVSASFRDAGFDAGFIAERACREAEDAVRWDNDPTTHLELAQQITPDAPCIGAVHDTIAGKKRKALLMTIAGIVVLILPIPMGYWLMRRRYRKLQKDLPEEEKADGATGSKLEDRLGPAGLGRQLQGALTEAHRELAGSAAGRALNAVDESVINAASSTVRRAAKTADAATLLVKKGGQAIYIVALPVRHPRPQITQRYLSAPWPEHLASIQRATQLPTLALVVLCGPDAAEATLLVGHTDGAVTSDPEALLDAKEARDRGANKFRAVMTLASADLGSRTTPTTDAKAA
ncbi:MAG: hypothetical protein JNL83_02630 [Myxococcales bacterium]|nr:hypothetical protein [Myxococcales bacterium]